MHERAKFIDAYQSGLYTMSELCKRYGVSRKTGYKWLDRFEESSYAGLVDASRAPVRHPNAMDEAVSKAILEVRIAHPYWGATKILQYLARRRPELLLPARSTVADHLKRHGFVKPRSRKRRSPVQYAGPISAAEPNEEWATDYKGEFKLQNGQYCYPLTTTDSASRFILGIKALPSTNNTGALEQFEWLFREYGLPQSIRTDNGSPFSTIALRGLSRLNVYWTKLGIHQERIPLGKPQLNGRHERMHRTLKEETARPPQATFADQQKSFDAFREEYNEIRPHESLDGAPPASHYRSSSRPYPDRIPEPEYPAYYEIRRVRHCGTFKFRGAEHMLSEVLTGEAIGLAEVEDGIWNIYFYDQQLARFCEKTKRVVP